MDKASYRVAPSELPRMRITPFDTRFFGPRRPAWHHLGQPNHEPVGAVEAFQRAGAYDVVLRPSDAPDKLDIRRKPTPVDRRWRTFDTVDRDYVLVPPDEITEIWDLNVQQPVETLGGVRYGRCLFITLRLPSFDVHGDVVDNYLILAHWMDATATTEIILAPVRLVCQNTLTMAQSRARERIRLTSGQDVRERMADQLTTRLRNAQANAAIVRFQYERL